MDSELLLKFTLFLDNLSRNSCSKGAGSCTIAKDILLHRAEKKTNEEVIR